MSSNFGPSPTGEFYPFIRRTDSSQSALDYSTNAARLRNPQAYSFQNLAPDALQHDQSMNSYAFNANSHFLSPGSRGNRDAGISSANGPNLQSALASSFNPPNPAPAYGLNSASKGFQGLSDIPWTQSNFLDPQNSQPRPLSFNSFNDNSGSRRATETPKSDLEDGELSERTDQILSGAQVSDSKKLNHHPSPNVNGTIHGKILEAHIPGRDLRDSQQRNEVAIRAGNGASKIRTTTSDAKRGSDATLRSQHKRSLKASKDGARRAVAELKPHNIGYAQLLEEHIHPDLLKSLFLELKSDVPEQVQAKYKSPKSATQAGQQYPLPQKLPEPGTEKDDVNSPLEGPIPSMKDARQSTSMYPMDRVQGQQEQMSKPGVMNTELDENSEERQPQKHSESNHSLSKTTDEPAAADKLALPMKPNKSREPANVLPNSKEKTRSPVVPNAKPSAVQVIAAKPSQPSATSTVNKSPLPKAAPKAVDRKDYIARLQAAKAGKAPPATISSQSTVDPVSHSTPHQPSPSLKGQIVTASPSKDNHLKDHVPAKVSAALPSSSTIATPSANTANEAKKREQTELARRKIEELKNRSKAMGESIPATNEASTPAPAPAASASQLSQTKQQSMDVESNRASTYSSISALVQAMPQHAYFRSQNATLSLPGLFMSNPQSQNNVATHTPDINSTQPTVNYDSRDTKSYETNTPSADSMLYQSDPTSEKSVPPVQEKQALEPVPSSQSTWSQANSNPRKRPTAADFIEPMPSKLRRSHSYRADSSVVFEISDDEADGSENGHSDVHMNNGNTDVSHSWDLREGRSGSMDHTSSNQLPALNDASIRSEQPNGKVNRVPHGSQTPTKKDSDGLRAREEEIERMNRKISEMEQRRKMRQDASRAQTPATPGRPFSFPKPIDSSSNVQTASSSTRKLSEPTFHVAPTMPPTGDTSNHDATMAKRVPPEERAKNIELVETILPLAKPADEPTTNAREEQLQHWKTEIESNLSSVDAALQNLKSRLETLHKETADLETQFQRENDNKRALQKELSKMLPVSWPARTVFGEPNGSATELRLASEGPQSGTQVPLQAVPDTAQSVTQEMTGIVMHEDPESGGLPAKPETFPGQSPPETALSTEAPTNQSMVSGELAEDVMDISGSEDEGEVADNAPVSSADAGQLITDNDSNSNSNSEAPYEPPASFGDLEDGPELTADAHEQQHPLTSASLRQHDNLGSQQITPAVVVEEDPCTPSPAGHPQSPIDLSDSDDYEPPEPVASVDPASLTPNAAISISDEPSFSPLDADQNTQANVASPDPSRAAGTPADTPAEGNDQAVVEPAQALRQDSEQRNDKHGHFIPYESPLQQFHAYRYHPDFVSRVGHGYRSLTYSHSIDARKPICPFEIGGRYDMILVQMGDIPEGLSEAQRSAFVVGLRQVIQEIRGRKVKDFKTVASEIAAYRARFLGDSSRILPL
ncbi:MAG: hypothetical protein Q9182_001377 [Xanthomendoza sp. 2 TL-2023]